MLSDANTKAADAKLVSCHVHQGIVLLQHIPHILSDLPRPNLLHPTQIGMLDHLQTCIFHFMKKNTQLDKYNVIGLSVLAYDDLTPRNLSYMDLSQWNGKEMKEMTW